MPVRRPMSAPPPPPPPDVRYGSDPVCEPAVGPGTVSTRISRRSLLSAVVWAFASLFGIRAAPVADEGAFWLVGGNGRSAPVEEGRRLLAVCGPTCPWVEFPGPEGTAWRAERSAGGWNLVQRSGKGAGRVRHTAHERK